MVQLEAISHNYFAISPGQIARTHNIGFGNIVMAAANTYRLPLNESTFIELCLNLPSMNENGAYNNFIQDRAISKVGFWAGLIAFIAITAFGIFQAMQVAGMLTYPRDEILIYGSSLCITIPFMLEMLALHHITRPERKFWSHTAVIFTVIYVVFVTANYVVQLATVIPATVKGLPGNIDVLRQTPHSMFWNFDALGYIAMGFATLFAVPVFEKKGFQKWVRYTFLVHSLTTPLIAFVYFSPVFSNSLLLVATPWAITAPAAMLMLALMFKKLQP